MAIQPIDLSTVYSQMDNVSKMNGAQLQAAQQVSREHVEKLQKDEFQAKGDVHSIESRKNEDNRIKNESKGNSGEEETESKKKSDGEEDQPKPSVSEVKDPRVGRFVDLMG